MHIPTGRRRLLAAMLGIVLCAFACRRASTAPPDEPALRLHYGAIDRGRSHAWAPPDCGGLRFFSPSAVFPTTCSTTGGTLVVRVQVRDIARLLLVPDGAWPDRLRLTFTHSMIEKLSVHAVGDSGMRETPLCGNAVHPPCELSELAAKVHSRTLGHQDPGGGYQVPDTEVTVELEVDGPQLPTGRPLEIGWVDGYRR